MSGSRLSPTLISLIPRMRLCASSGLESAAVDEHGRAVLLHRLAISAMRRRDLTRARSFVEESHSIHERADDRWGLAQTIATLGAIERDAGNEERAFELIETAATMVREVGVRWWESGLLAELATLALNAGRVDEAETLARESLLIADQIGDRGGRVFGVGLFRSSRRHARTARARRAALGRRRRRGRRRTARRLEAPPSQPRGEDRKRARRGLALTRSNEGADPRRRRHARCGSGEQATRRRRCRRRGRGIANRLASVAAPYSSS
jgi:hypothetical protein